MFSPHMPTERVHILEQSVAELTLDDHLDGAVDVLHVAGHAVLMDALLAVHARRVRSYNTHTQPYSYQHVR
jgi:hypothetical protein